MNNNSQSSVPLGGTKIVKNKKRKLNTEWDTLFKKEALNTDLREITKKLKTF